MSSSLQQFSESFVDDLKEYHTEEKHYRAPDGKLVYSTSDLCSLIGLSNSVLASCEIKDTSGNPLALSNVNMGHITQPNEITGAFVKSLGWGKMRGSESAEDISVREKYFQILRDDDLYVPFAKDLEDEDQNEWFCKGCSKSFATKSSLKRHHDRKKSCREICEKAEDLSGTSLEVPEKPYIVDWVDQILVKAISGDSDKPYCKHCDVEFANKTNLHKHLSKSVACDKLAKQEFLKALKLT